MLVNQPPSQGSFVWHHLYPYCLSSPVNQDSWGGYEVLEDGMYHQYLIWLLWPQAELWLPSGIYMNMAMDYKCLVVDYNHRKQYEEKLNSVQVNSVKNLCPDHQVRDVLWENHLHSIAVIHHPWVIVGINPSPCALGVVSYRIPIILSPPPPHKKGTITVDKEYYLVRLLRVLAIN